MSRGKRERLEEGIYGDRFGLSATVKVGRLQREKRFTLNTDRKVLRAWRTQVRAELERERPDPFVDPLAPPRGTLEAEGTRWIARRKGAPAFKADRSHLRAWFAVLGPRLRHAITRLDVQTAIAGWQGQTPPVAARTIRHRCRVLRELYRTLDGREARTPVDHVALPKPSRATPMPVPAATIRKVATNLKRAGLTKDYARFLVRATTGQRPAQVMRTRPADVDFKRRVWFVRPSKDGVPVPLPLNVEMTFAWKTFAGADAWGPFDTARFADILRAHGWPAGIRPYALRHTFAIDLILSGADLGDVQGLLGHTQIQTTREFYAPILGARLRRVTARRTLGLCQPRASRR